MDTNFDYWKSSYEIYLSKYYNTIVLPSIKKYNKNIIINKTKLYNSFCYLLYTKSSGDISFWI